MGITYIEGTVTGPVGNRLAVVLSAALLVMVAAWVVWQFN